MAELTTAPYKLLLGGRYKDEYGDVEGRLVFIEDHHAPLCIIQDSEGHEHVTSAPWLTLIAEPEGEIIQETLRLGGRNHGGKEGQSLIRIVVHGKERLGVEIEDGVL